jgi:hypothetical protein
MARQSTAVAAVPSWRRFVSPPREDPRDWAARGSHKNGLLTDQAQAYSEDDLRRRRAEREAFRALYRLEGLLSLFRAGEIELDELAFGIGLLGAKLGRLACSGVLDRLVIGIWNQDIPCMTHWTATRRTNFDAIEHNREQWRQIAELKRSHGMVDEHESGAA